MQAYVKALGSEWPVQVLDEYRTERGRTVARVVVAGYPGVNQYRTISVPTDEVTIR